MTSARKRCANRRNARKCTGPRTAAGKARSARNALRHGLARSARLDLELMRAIATLARAIAGEGASDQRRKCADRIAAAHVEVMRVRKAKQGLYAQGRDWDDFTKRLVKLDRYERRALSRRKFAMRRLDAAPPATQSDVWLEHFGKTKPSVVARSKRPQRRISRCARGRAAWPSGWFRRRVPRWRVFFGRTKPSKYAPKVGSSQAWATGSRGLKREREGRQVGSCRHDPPGASHGIHCADTCSADEGRDSSTATMMARKAPMIRTSEIAMATISARSSRRSCSECFGGENPFVLKIVHSRQNESRAFAAKSGERRQQRHAIARLA